MNSYLDERALYIMSRNKVITVFEIEVFESLSTHFLQCNKYYVPVEPETCSSKCPLFSSS